MSGRLILDSQFMLWNRYTSEAARLHGMDSNLYLSCVHEDIENGYHDRHPNSDMYSDLPQANSDTPGSNCFRIHLSDLKLRYEMIFPASTTLGKVSIMQATDSFF
jgi:hypothetical protein